ncbi:MAG: hypothetical protein WC856_02500 [Methylococcaceae bacterium]|jgi:hypothetical protein
MSKIKLGAPSLTGGVARSTVVNDAFSHCNFPIDVKVSNLVAHGLNFPEVAGLALSACTDALNSEVIVEIKDLDALHRLVSSIEQVAELHSHAEMLVIELVPRDEDLAYVVDQETLYAEPEAVVIAPEVITEPPKKAAQSKRTK